MELIIHFLECPSFNKETNFLPIVFINPLLFNYDVLLDIGIRSFWYFGPIELEPSLINLYSSLIANTRHSKLSKVNLGSFLRHLCKINLFFLFGRFLFIELFHKLKVFFVGVLNGFLQLDDSGLLFQGLRCIALEFKIAEDATGRRILRSEAIGADELVQIVQPNGNVITYFYVTTILLRIFS